MICNFGTKRLDRCGGSGRIPNLREEGVEAMNLLPLLDKGIVLSYAAQCKFIHEINFMWSVHMFVLFGTQLVVACVMLDEGAP